jgi:peptide chain release factor 1
VRLITDLDKLRHLRKNIRKQKTIWRSGVYTDPALYAKYAREQKELAPVVEAYRRYTKRRADMEGALELMGDPEMKEMAQEEYRARQGGGCAHGGELKILLLPRDPNDSRNVIVEINAAAPAR